MSDELERIGALRSAVERARVEVGRLEAQQESAVRREAEIIEELRGLGYEPGDDMHIQIAARAERLDAQRAELARDLGALTDRAG